MGLIWSTAAAGGEQTTTPGAFVEEKGTLAARERLGEVAGAMMKLRRQLMEAKDRAADALAALFGPGTAAAANATQKGDVAAEAVVAELQEQLAVLQREQVELQQKLASKESVPKQV